MTFNFRPAKRENVPQDVWTRVDIREPDECWPFLGARNAKGYGQMRVKMRQHPAHRLAYATATGTEPGDLCVLHRCDNPPCCNPAHLFLGTHGDNNRDTAAKGRTARGELHHKAKLTAEQVRTIDRKSVV